jgi:three-Cys-motif partner protein
MTAGDEFFDEITRQSRVKVEIVQKYFSTWAKVILPTVEKRNGKLGYIDLFSGPGIYEDGTKSTPIIVLEEAIKNPKLVIRLVTIFNDANPDYIIALRKNINRIPGIDGLRNKPILMNDPVGNELVDKFEEINFIPSLFFIDPWGYKGLSLSLLKSVLKDWGCDCIFFFNYKRINAGLNNPIFDDNIDAIFSKERAKILRKKLIRLDPQDRELTIIDELVTAINEIGLPYILPFCFKTESIKRTSHYLIFISKHPKGYEIMKNIMAKSSSEIDQGVILFQYCPATKKQPFLFSFNRPLDDLSQMLLDEYKGQSLTRREIFERHNIGKPFIEKNYREILIKMEKEGLIKTDPPISARNKGQFGPNVLVTFQGKQ